MTRQRLTTLDLPHFHRATIGFDQMFTELERQFANSPNGNGYPPYNIAQINEDEYMISHKGIGGRNFRREFTLADHVEVESAGLELGMLNVHLKRNVPEELQPKKIKIVDNSVIDSK